MHLKDNISNFAGTFCSQIKFTVFQGKIEIVNVMLENALSLYNTSFIISHILSGLSQNHGINIGTRLI